MKNRLLLVVAVLLVLTRRRYWPGHERHHRRERGRPIAGRNCWSDRNGEIAGDERHACSDDQQGWCLSH